MNKKVQVQERRRSITTAQLEELQRLTKQEIDELKENFKHRDKTGSGVVSRHDLIDILKDMGNYVSDSIKKRIHRELDDKGMKKLDFPTLCQIANDIKMWEEEEEDVNDDYVNAFVAMGGSPDTTGRVYKKTIIDIIKNEFELFFDIEDLLEKVGSQGDDLDFQTFCLLFEGNDEKSVTRRNSFLSALSDRGKRLDTTSSSFNVRYKDFEKFMEKVK